MTRMTRWMVGVVSMCALAGTAMTTRVAFAQDAKKEAPPAKGQDEKKGDAKSMHEEKLAELRKLVSSSKTSLVAAIEAAEKKSKGKSYAASFGISKEKKLTLHVEVLVGEKTMQVAVDPETGAASEPKEGEAEEHEGHERHGGN